MQRTILYWDMLCYQVIKSMIGSSRLDVAFVRTEWAEVCDDKKG